MAWTRSRFDDQKAARFTNTGNDAFEIALARFFEQCSTVRLGVVDVQYLLGVLPHDLPKPLIVAEKSVSSTLSRVTGWDRKGTSHFWYKNIASFFAS